MSSKKSDDDILEGCMAAIIGGIVAFIIGWWLAGRKPKRKEFLFSPTLEVDPVWSESITKNTKGYWTPERKKRGYRSAIFTVVSYAVIAVAIAFLGSDSGGEATAAEQTATRIIMLSVAIGLGLLAYWLWHKYQQVSVKPSVDFHSLPRPLNLNTAKVYSITLPSTTEWKPLVASQFMEQILQKLSGRLTFQIVAHERGITWRILDLRCQVAPELLRQAVSNFYPDAEVKEVSVFERARGYPFYRLTMAFQQAADFVYPILRVEDTKQYDPLVSLAQEMSSLRQGEQITYTLFVADVANYVYEQAEDILSVEQPNNPFKYLSTEGLIDAGYELRSGEKERLEVYDLQTRKIVEDKLHQLIFQCLLFVQIDTPSQERIEQLATINSHITQFRKLPYNVLVPYPKYWEKSVQLVGSGQQSATTGVLALINTWLTNISLEWRRFLLLLDSRELASLWHLPYSAFSASNIHWTRGKKVQMPRVLWDKTEGVCLGVNRYAGKERPAYILDEDRVTHMAIIGKNGVGKSSLMHRLIHEDIMRNRGVAVIDPHGALVSAILQSSIPPKREDDVVVLDIANQVNGMHYPPPMNMLTTPHGVEVETSAEQIMAVFEKIYSGFGQTEMADTLYNALQTLAHEPQATLVDVETVFTDPNYRHQLMANVDNIAVEQFWNRFEAAGQNQQQQWTRPVLRRLRSFYGNRHLYPIMCHPDPLDISSLISQNKIILISIHAPEAKIRETERTLLGALLVSQIEMAAMANAITKPPFYLYVDETQNFVTTSLPKMLSESRKYGLALTLANQFLKQLAGNTLDAVMGNVGAMNFFELGEPDAKAVASYVKPHLTPEDLMRLGRFKMATVMRYKGERLPTFTINTLPPPKQKDRKRAIDRETYLRQKSVENYTPKSYDDVNGWLRDKYRSQSKPDQEINGKDDSDDEFIQPN